MADKFTLDTDPVLRRKLRSGDSASITVNVYDDDGNAVALDDDSVSEIGATGIMYWSASNFTTKPVSGENKYLVRFINSAITQEREVEFIWFEDKAAYLEGAIWVDFDSGTAGTGEMIGTPYKPSSNWADAITIATRNNISKFKIKGNNTLSQSMAGYAVEGYAAKESFSVDINGQSVANTQFKNVTLTGTCNGSFKGDDIVLDTITDLECRISNGYIAGNLTVKTGGEFTIFKGSVLGAAKTIDCGTDGVVVLNQFGGAVNFENLTSVGVIIYNGYPSVTLDSSISSGIIAIDGFGPKVTNNATNIFAFYERTFPQSTFEELAADHNTAGTFGEMLNSAALAINRAIGLMQENFYLDNAVYNSDDVLTSARIRTYSAAGSVGTDSDVLATYTITATWDSENMLTYKVVKS